MLQFTVVIPCFNAANTISETLDSIRAQTCASWEVICVDDGSTDLTRDIIVDAHNQDPRIKLVQNVAKGPSMARNLAAKGYGKGAIIAFCDADDVWSPTKLAELQAVFDDPTVDAAYGKVAFFEGDPQKASVYSTVPKGDLTIPMLLGENPVCTMSNISVRTDAFVSTGGFDKELVHNEDLDWLIRLVGSGARVVGINLCQTYYRASRHGLSADLAKMDQSRAVAIQSAAAFGFAPTPAANAIYFRYLARRALRLGQKRGEALRFALCGLRSSPVGFFSAPKRGALTLIGAAIAVALPDRVSQFIFSR